MQQKPSQRNQLHRQGLGLTRRTRATRDKRQEMGRGRGRTRGTAPVLYTGVAWCCCSRRRMDASSGASSSSSSSRSAGFASSTCQLTCIPPLPPRGVPTSASALRLHSDTTPTAFAPRKPAPHTGKSKEQPVTGGQDRYHVRSWRQNRQKGLWQSPLPVNSISSSCQHLEVAPRTLAQS